MISGVRNNDYYKIAKQASLTCFPYLMAWSICFPTDRKRGWQVVLVQLIIIEVVVVVTTIEKKQEAF